MAPSLKEIPTIVKAKFDRVVRGFNERREISLQKKEVARLEQIKRQLNLTHKEIIAIVEQARYAPPYPIRQALIDAVEARMLPKEIQWSDVKAIAQNELSKMLDLSDDEAVAVIVSDRGGKLSLELESHHNEIQRRSESLDLLWPDVIRTAVIAMVNRNLQDRVDALTLQK